MGDRYQRTVGTVTTDYLLDVNSTLSQVLRESTQGQQTWYLLGQDIIGQQRDDQWAYFGYDGLGSVRQILDATGAVRAMVNYDPYGTPFERYGSPTSTSLGFTGEQTDPDGLVYLRARYYKPQLGAFLSRDPVEGVFERINSRNGYSYTEGNPVNYSDPSGRCIGFLGGIDTLFCAAVIATGFVALTGALSAREWDISHECQCGSAYGTSKGDFVQGRVLPAAGMAAVGLIFPGLVPLMLGYGILSAGKQIVDNRNPQNPAQQFKRDEGLLNLGIAAVSVGALVGASRSRMNAQRALIAESQEGIYTAPAQVDTGEPFQFTKAEFRRYQAALESLRNGERIKAPEVALLRRVAAHELWQGTRDYIPEIYKTLNGAKNRAIGSLRRQSDVVFRAREIDVALLDLFDKFVPKPVGSHAITMKEALAWEHLSPLGRRLLKLYMENKGFTEETLPATFEAKGEFGYRVVETGGNIKEAVSDYDIAFVVENGLPLPLNSPIYDEMIGRDPGNYIAKLIQHSDHLGGAAVNKPGAIASKMEGLVEVYRNGELVKTGEFMDILVELVGARNPLELFESMALNWPAEQGTFVTTPGLPQLFIDYFANRPQ
jgi:RHS repeat-associated protein